jgi:aquaglyceroporin related protein, other eukaryote
MENIEKPKDHPKFGRAPGSSSSSPASDEVTFTHREHDDAQNARSMDPNPQVPYPFHQEHGPPIDNYLASDEAEEDYQHHKNLWWSRVRHHLRDPFAEFMGTFIMILFGDGSVAQVTLSANPKLPQSSQNKGDYQSISWG